MDGVHRFFEEDTEVKKNWYTHDLSGNTRVVYNGNFDLSTSPTASRRDTLYCVMAPNCPTFEELPPSSRYLQNNQFYSELNPL